MMTELLTGWFNEVMDDEGLPAQQRQGITAVAGAFLRLGCLSVNGDDPLVVNAPHKAIRPFSGVGQRSAINNIGLLIKRGHIKKLGISTYRLVLKQAIVTNTESLGAKVADLNQRLGATIALIEEEENSKVQPLHLSSNVHDSKVQPLHLSHPKVQPLHLSGSSEVDSVFPPLHPPLSENIKQESKQQEVKTLKSEPPLLSPPDSEVTVELKLISDEIGKLGLAGAMFGRLGMLVKYWHEIYPDADLVDAVNWAVNNWEGLDEKRKSNGFQAYLVSIIGMRDKWAKEKKIRDGPKGFGGKQLTGDHMIDDPPRKIENATEKLREEEGLK